MIRLLSTLALLGLLFACAGGGLNLPPVSTEGGAALPGKIVWRDLLTDHPEASRRFYGELFGWEFKALPGNAN